MSQVKTGETRELPEGWRWVKLGEVCEVVTGSTPPRSETKYYGTDIPWIKPDDLDRDMIICSSTEYLSNEGGKIARLLPMKSVLVSCIGKIGKVALSGCEVATNQQINSLIPGNEVDPIFLYYCCKKIRPQLELLASIALLPILNKSDFSSVEIPLPPFPEQQRIALLLKEQMAAVDAARLAAQERLQAIKALPAAYLRQVFPSPGAALPDGWRWVKLGEVCEINPRRPIFERPDNKPTSFIPMEAVDALSGTVIDKRAKPYIEIKRGYTYFSDKDVLFAKITPCMQNGKHTIAADLIDGIGFGTTEFHVLRAHNEIIPEWIWYYVRQPGLLREATEHFTGAVGQQRLPSDYLANLVLPLPPIFEQLRIATRLKDHMAGVEQARLAAEAELTTINSLPSALLRRAFNGEL